MEYAGVCTVNRECLLGSTRVCLRMSGRATANSVWAGLDLRDGFFGRAVEGGYRDCWFLVVIAVPGCWSGSSFAYQNGQVSVSRELDGEGRPGPVDGWICCPYLIKQAPGLQPTTGRK